ncbi:MAG: ABC transporter permease [Candidatus Lambdaproteobacteria bacterium]|nr:ABC transporter permease [Candidatus Lambdaproteobacteria bacterium]
MNAAVLGSAERVAAMLLRYGYLLRGSWPRLLELVYWPTVQMMLWGFMTNFLVTNSTWVAQAAGVLISGVLLWDILYRSQLGVAMMFLEEMYARNLGQLFVSPLRPLEWVISLVTVSLLRTLISFVGASLLAILFYHFSIFSLGFPLIFFFFNLMVMGWAIGLAVCGLVLRYGMGAESMAWVAIFALAPFTGIYYPIGSLPAPLQVFAHLLPSSYVFEGMRAVLIQHVVRYDLLRNAVALNVVYMVLGTIAFLIAFRAARVRGMLIHVGE